MAANQEERVDRRDEPRASAADSRKVASSRAFLVREGPFVPFDAPTVRAYSCSYDRAHYDDGLFAHLEIDPAPSLGCAVVKRKAEFLAGRYAARRALKELGVTHAHVGVGLHRVPLWPDGVVGSITHTNVQAVCAVAHGAEYQGLGIDLENWMAENTAENVKTHVVGPSEERILAALPLGFARSITLAFSAKESVFKALYPQVRHYFDFDAAELHHVDLEAGRFTALLTRDLTTSLVRGHAVHGRVTVGYGTVFTAVIRPAARTQ